jgi:hypothetical protein
MAVIWTSGVLLAASTQAAEQPPRVFVTGADSVVAQGVKEFRKSCPAVALTTRQDNADYSVLVADDGSGAGRKGRSAILSAVSGDVILASSTRALESAIKNTCDAIRRDWTAKLIPAPK